MPPPLECLCSAVSSAYAARARARARARLECLCGSSAYAARDDDAARARELFKLLKLILDCADLCGMLVVVQLSPDARQSREEHEK